MKLTDFDYELPGELIAQYPSDNREDSRLVVFRRERNDINETRFANFPRYLQHGDLVVINDTKVFPSRILGKKSSGADIEVFLTRQIEPGRWEALVRPSKRLREGGEVLVGEGCHSIGMVRELGSGRWEVEIDARMPDWDFIETYGRVPLPPYIKRDAEKDDGKRYQTIYASKKGSVAAPTAGLHFTEELIRKIKHKGCTILTLTLHIGPGTFRPLERETVEANRLSYEFLRIRKDVWDVVKTAKRERRRVVAVGTTTTRVLESLAHGSLRDRREEEIDGEIYISGRTNLFIYPGFEFRAVDALVTNFHLPRSSLFLLVCAFAGRDNMMNIYNWAVRRDLRFYSYGDVMFIQ